MTQDGINLAMTRGEKWRGTREQDDLGDLSSWERREEVVAGKSFQGIGFHAHHWGMVSWKQMSALQQ